jgi:hypothetical protein
MASAGGLAAAAALIRFFKKNRMVDRYWVLVIRVLKKSGMVLPGCSLGIIPLYLLIRNPKLVVFH